MLFIGIDPGEHTGLAVWDGASRTFLLLATLPLHRALAEVYRYAVGGEWESRRQGVPVHVIFEDARQRKWFRRDTSESEYRGHLMGAGAAKRDAAIWEEYLSDKKGGCYGRVTFEAQPPRPGMTKWNAESFASVTGYTARTSGHARDAALLVYGLRKKAI